MSAPLFRAAAAVSLALSLTACAAHRPEENRGARYRVTWSAERIADHAPLGSGATTLRLGGAARVNTGAPRPTLDRPVITEYSVALQSLRPTGTVEVVSRTSLAEVTQTPKGKLKRTKRVIGALLPMRAGEQQVTSSPSDSIAVTLRLERASAR